MKPVHALSSTLLAALVLATCGANAADARGGSAAPSRPAFTSIVSFGDSLSDAGTYTPATVIPGTDPPIYLGGKFTTNWASGSIWVEDVAAQLGLVVTPAEVGFAGQSVKCPAAALGLANTCTAYGQGGARVTDPNGIGHVAGALTVPLKTQIANHLAAFQRFKSTDLVTLWAGANDLLWQIEPDPAINPDSFVIKYFQIQAQLQAGLITAEQAAAQVAQAQRVSQAAMRTAATELAGYIRTQIVANGATHVVVMNLPDPVVTPEGAATAAAFPDIGAAMTSFSVAFNDGLRRGLHDSRVRTIDIRSLISDVVAHPSAHQMVNASVPACDPDKILAITGGGVTTGSALFCNATPGVPWNAIRDGADVFTWYFADGNHPTTGGHRVIGDEVMRQLKSFGWIN